MLIYAVDCHPIQRRAVMLLAALCHKNRSDAGSCEPLSSWRLSSVGSRPLNKVKHSWRQMKPPVGTPYMANRGMCCCTGYGFWRLCPNEGKVILWVCPKKRVYFVLCPKHGPKMKGVVLNRVGILGLFFVLNRVRVSIPQRQPYTQTRIKCPPPPRTEPSLLRSNAFL